MTINSGDDDRRTEILMVTTDAPPMTYCTVLRSRRSVIAMFVFTLLVVSQVSAQQTQTTQPATSNRAPGPRTDTSDRQVNRWDIVHASPLDHPLHVRIVVPRNVNRGKPTDRPPLVVFIHGGGWQGGSYTSKYCDWLTEHGFAIASIQYRLTDVACFPAQVHDCKSAMRYLRANADRYGYNATRIGVAGSSAGGYLALMLGVTNGVASLEGEIGEHDEVSSRVDAVVDFYGASDFVHRSTNQPHKTEQRDGPVRKLLGTAVKADIPLARFASPITHVSKDDPPLMVIHGMQDKTVLVDQAQRMIAAYQKKQFALELEPHLIPGAGHGGAEFRTQEIRDAIVSFLRRHLGQNPGEVTESPRG